MGYSLDAQNLIPSRSKKFFSTPQHADRLCKGSTQPPTQGVPRALSWEVKWPECEADHSPPSSAEVKNGGAIPPLPDISSWHGA
jgi:hypothetical protein